MTDKMLCSVPASKPIGTAIRNAEQSMWMVGAEDVGCKHVGSAGTEAGFGIGGETVGTSSASASSCTVIDLNKNEGSSV